MQLEQMLFIYLFEIFYFWACETFVIWSVIVACGLIRQND